jgi:NADPH:quinone reductase-like Zn-dependent oxidoreductase
VQIAKALGAEVTGVASASRADLVTGFGADHFVDYRETAVGDLSGPYDVVFDTVGAIAYPRRAHAGAGGRFVPLNFGLSDMGHARQARRNGHKVILKVNGDTKESLARLTGWMRRASCAP